MITIRKRAAQITCRTLARRTTIGPSKEEHRDPRFLTITKRQPTPRQRIHRQDAYLRRLLQRPEDLPRQGAFCKSTLVGAWEEKRAGIVRFQRRRLRYYIAISPTHPTSTNSTRRFRLLSLRARYSILGEIDPLILCVCLLQGKLYVRGDSKIFRFQNGKSESLFLQRKNPRRIAWTVLYRRQHRKGISEVRYQSLHWFSFWMVLVGQKAV